MAGGMEHSGEHGTGARVHESMTRSHRMREGEQANTSRPKRWPKGASVAVVAMDGGRRSSAHAVRALGTVKQ